MTTIHSSVLGGLIESFGRSLRAQNKSARTVTAYLEACTLFHAYLAGQGMPLDPAHIAREHIESFIEAQLLRWKPSTANNRYRGLQQFFRWLLEEGEVKSSPMANMKPPMLPETLPPVLTDAQIGALLKACSGREFTALRDTALILLLLDTGMRASECVGITVDRMDLTANLAVVLGKGRRERACPFGRKTAQAIDRYQRARQRHSFAHSDAFFIGKRGRMSASGLYQVVNARGHEAGIEGLHPHTLRHTFAHRWLVAGGQEQDLMVLAGWRSRTMLGRYASSTAGIRARQAHSRLGLMDSL